MGLGGRWVEMDLWNCEREMDYCEERMKGNEWGTLQKKNEWGVEVDSTVIKNNKWLRLLHKRKIHGRQSFFVPLECIHCERNRQEEVVWWMW